MFRVTYTACEDHPYFGSTLMEYEGKTLKEVFKKIENPDDGRNIVRADIFDDNNGDYYLYYEEEYVVEEVVKLNIEEF